jgi:acid phosphatase class B
MRSRDPRAIRLVASILLFGLAFPAVAGATGHALAPSAESLRARAPAAHVDRPASPAPVRAEPASRATPPPSIQLPRSGLSQPLDDRAASVRLTAVQERVATLTASGKKPWVIMDIDDTLMRTVSYPHNVPVDGAVAYAKSLTRAGATIVYVTGRKDTPGEHTKTLATLREFGFPLGEQGAVKLNGTKLSTVLYKKQATDELVKKLGEPVAAFDNEIANARMFRSELPRQSAVFRLATASFSKDTGGSGKIDVIKNFAPKDGAPSADGAGKTAPIAAEDGRSAQSK